MQVKNISEFHEVNLSRLGNGAAVEMFNKELQSVLLNIMDVNTKAEKPREIVMKFTIIPDENREKAKIAIQSVAKLAPIKPFLTNIYMGMQGDEFKAVEDGYVEQRLPFNAGTPDNVEQLTAQGGTK